MQSTDSRFNLPRPAEIKWTRISDDDGENSENALFAHRRIDAQYRRSIGSKALQVS